MPIINNNSYPFILTWDWRGDFRDLPTPHKIQLKNNAPIFHLKEWSETKNYWFIEFLHADAFYHFDIEDIIPYNILQKIKKGDVTLVLQNCHEGYHSVVEGIYQDIVIKHSINPRHIMLISVSRDIEREINHMSEKYTQDKLSVEWFNIFEHNAKVEILNCVENVPRTLEIKKYEKKFLSFNGMWRPHRSMLVASLISNDLLEKGFVSFNTVDESAIDARENFDFLLEFNKHNPEFLFMLVNNSKKIKEVTQLFLDTQPGDSSNRNLATVQSIPMHLYEDTYFSVVTETNFSTETSDHHNTFSGETGIGRLLSEKTFKCIALKHPFILVTVPGTLKLLKELGYKTFGSLINESYDNESDYTKRMIMITKEIDRLCNLSDSQLESFLVNCREICEHNYNLLINRSNYVYQIT